MAKTCAELFSGLPCTILGNGGEQVSGIAYRSDRVRPGDAFFCIVGLKADGHSYAQDAIDRGARVLVVERKVYLADATDVTEVVVDDSRRALSLAAAAFYDKPSETLDIVGITGTNGKTTTTYLTQSILERAGLPCGVIGTIGVSIGAKREKTANTTPESSDLQGIFAQMRDGGCRAAAIEVSSHALDLERVWGTRFAVTAFTNLTQDHLDYHHTFEAYFEAKALLFGPAYPAKRVICTDDHWGRQLYQRCIEAGDACITTGFDGSCDIHPTSIEYHPDCTRLELQVLGRAYPVEYPLSGKFNVSNVMTAFAIALQMGVPAEDIAEALKGVEGVPGRMQRVRARSDGGVSVYVDYAHTPDALEKAIATVREICAGRVIVVFGCGGDRDSSKRSIMGRASLGADFAVVTSDNPRSEDPQAIISDIVSGMGGEQGRFAVEPDRRKAIRHAIEGARAEDAILIAGKGHEDYQILADRTISFDDSVVAAEELERAFCR